jgi:hypothetical protein
MSTPSIRRRFDYRICLLKDIKTDQVKKEVKTG